MSDAPTTAAATPRRHLVIALHAHLPECRRPTLTRSLEETWYFEALTESYLPLVEAFDRLAADRIPFQLTLSVSPPLIDMLRDPALRERYRQWLHDTEALARADATAASGPRRPPAHWHANRLREIARLFDQRCAGDLPGVLGEFHAAGRLELGTTAATHAFLPAHQTQPATVRAQVAIGIDVFAAAFGFRPEFFWLPECGYFPGLDRVLAENGVRTFAVESHAITQATPRPPRGLRAPVRTPAGLCALGRDAGLSRVVWSAPEGYPGHADYREFHRDAVHDLPDELARAWMAPDGRRLPAGLKYWRVTGPHGEKDWYDPTAAAKCARAHAEDFVGRIARADGGDGVWFVPFDAELFGHWWFEGPRWLEHVFRALATHPNIVAQSATRAAAANLSIHDARPAPSSWGQAGDHSYWVNPDNAWIYPHLFHAARRFDRMLVRYGHFATASPEARALRQTARTLLLAQASDWPFLIKAGTAADLAAKRISDLLARFAQLCGALEAGAIDDATLRACEAEDLAFPQLEWRRFLQRVS